MTKYNYLCSDSILPSSFCDDVVSYALEQKDSLAVIGGWQKKFEDKTITKDDIRNLKNVRDSKVVWLDANWIYRMIIPFVEVANKKAGWNYQIDYPEQCQFTKYELNQYYDWHQDADNFIPDDGPQKGTLRKLSMTCQLTDGSEYEGGELEFDFRDYNPVQRDEAKHLIKCTEIMKKGSIVVFPSYLWHRVKPVTKGTRYSLVCWHRGKSYV